MAFRKESHTPRLSPLSLSLSPTHSTYTIAASLRIHSTTIPLALSLSHYLLSRAIDGTDMFPHQRGPTAFWVTCAQCSDAMDQRTVARLFHA